MKMTIKKLIIDNFKGVTHGEYSFGELTSIFGANETGKSTINTAFMWLFADKSYELVSNPNIRPNDDRECIPTVAAILDIDGAECTVAKMQKKTTSKPDADGKVKTSLSNTYEVNSVPKTERDFKACLEDKGLRFDLFPTLSHPDVFTMQKQADMRKFLFGMSSGKSDYDIAQANEDTATVAELLKSYKLDEIEAMNKASRKKAADKIEAIPNQIIGMENSKVEIDVAELELAKADLKRRIAEVDAKINSKSSVLEELQQKELKLQFELNAIYTKANDDCIRGRRQFEDSIAAAESDLRKAESGLSNAERFIAEKKELIAHSKTKREELIAEYKAVNEEKFDPSKFQIRESDKACSMCGQSLPAEKIKTLAADADERCKRAESEFKAKKKFSLEEIEKAATKKSEIEKEHAEEIKAHEVEIRKYKSDIEDSKNRIAELGLSLSKMADKPDLSANAEYQKLFAKHEDIKRQIAELPAVDNSDLETEKLGLETDLNSVTEKIGQSLNNVRIDERIADLQSDLRAQEQNKADAERILYQLKLVNERKNTLLVEEINQHFTYIKWKLFDYQKNGEYTDTCIPVIDGREYKVGTNKAREIKVRLDICNSLQKFYGMFVPVFLDNAESVNVWNLPKMDTQLIVSYVDTGKELRIETN